MVNGVAVCFPQGHHWESSSFGPSPTSCNDFSHFIPESDGNTSGTGADQEPVPLTLAEDWTLKNSSQRVSWNGRFQVNMGFNWMIRGYHYFRKPQFWAFDNNKSPGAATWNLTRHSHSRVASRFMLPSHHWQSYFSVAYCDRFVTLLVSFHTMTQWPTHHFAEDEEFPVLNGHFRNLNWR